MQVLEQAHLETSQQLVAYLAIQQLQTQVGVSLAVAPRYLVSQQHKHSHSSQQVSVSFHL
jgi:hypothetical protein